jgi:hypothetical protein
MADGNPTVDPMVHLPFELGLRCGHNLLTSLSDLTAHEISMSSLHEILTVVSSPLKISLMRNLLCDPPTDLKALFLLRFFQLLRLLEKRTLCTHSLRQPFQQRLSVEFTRLCTLLQQQSSNTSLRFTTLRLSLGLHTPCTTLCLTTLSRK